MISAGIGLLLLLWTTIIGPFNLPMAFIGLALVLFDVALSAHRIASLLKGPPGPKRHRGQWAPDDPVGQQLTGEPIFRD